MLGLDYHSSRGYVGLEHYGRMVSMKILLAGIHMGQLESIKSFPHTLKKVCELKESFEGRRPFEEEACLAAKQIIAAGPFTTTDNLFFEPLTELLAYAQRKQPQLLLLLGPFIDSEHPEIKKGAVNRTFDEIFRLEILGRLQDYVEYMGSAARVILVPSIRDANHDFVFPQPAFDIHLASHNFKEITLSYQITSLTNPGIFSANEIKVGCCTVDILKQLSGEEISRNPSGGSKQCMNRLANHLLSQHSFYPLYPPMEDTRVDFSLAPEALQIPCNLDILILSSDLDHFVKVLSIGDKNDGEEQAKCICVNPGRLARGEGAGFFMELNYGGSSDSASASVISI
ncbi:DNA polymerase alpha subunit B-like [Camellia sinensis]|uniref:DNA polymerase alpha subunit B-like n=1 Tax=Camellia sinensis TaxID=4442 RepID=UPI001036CF7F|nr:DNA polymerase alpha subunit B-like [Camellia sinensis]